MFVADSDLRTLTGYTRPSAQLRWLRAHGWTYEVGGDGRPKVSRAYAERRLGAVDSAPPRREPQLHLPARAAHGTPPSPR